MGWANETRREEFKACLRGKLGALVDASKDDIHRSWTNAVVIVVGRVDRLER